MKFRFLILINLVFVLGLMSCNNAKNNGTEKEFGDSSKTAVKKVPEWSKNAVMYEVNLRQFSKEGTVAAFEKELPRLKELGVDIIWFMPIHPIGVKNRKGTLGSYYSVKDYKAIAPEYGSIDDFKALVKKAHSMNMKVIIDWVANHTAFDNVWVEQGHTDWYTPDSLGKMQPPIGTDWWDVADLNFDNKEMRAAMIDAMKFWVKECDIDGYRCDVADWVPVDFWNEVRPALDSIKPVFMLAEAENVKLHEKAFDMTYGWEFHFIMNEVAQGKKSVNDIRKYLNGKAKEFPKEAFRLHFTSNHDENSWKGTEKERLGDAVKSFAVLAATLEGMPLIYNGQEASLEKRLKFFEKDPIVWKDWKMTDFYKPLLKLKHENQALWNGTYGGDLNILSPETDTLGFAFERSKEDNSVFCVFNFSKTPREVSFDKSKLKGDYTELYSNKKLDATSGKIKMGAWEYLVYYK
jgi:glycosidase